MRHRLIQLLSDNRRPFQPVAAHIVRTQAQDDEATVYLYDPIVSDRATAEWWGGVCPQDLVPALAALDVGTIHLRINSPGGDVFAAQAISQALREHPATVIGHIDGVAASAATEIACACDSTVIAAGGMYMIHQAWTFALGNADDLEKTVALLRKVDGQLADTYAATTGKDRDTIDAWMKAETWFTAAEAVAEGFVGAIAEPAVKEASAQGAWNLRAYARAPAALRTSAAQRPALPQPDPAPAAATPDHRNRQHQRLRLLTACAPIV